MELTKPGLLILVIIGSVAVCHCGPTSTCPLVGVRVNGQTINKPPRHKDVLFYAQQNANGGIKFSYWTYSIGRKLKDLNKLNMVIVAKSQKVKLNDMPSIITVEGIYGESEGRLHKFKKLFVRGSGTDRDTSDIKHKKRSKRRSSSGSQSSIEPNNCENENRTYFKIGIGVSWHPSNPTDIFIIYLPLIENSKYSCSIGYLRENQEPIFYPLPPIAKGVQKFLMLTLAEDGKIIQDGFALAADIPNNLISNNNFAHIIEDWRNGPKLEVRDLFLRRKNQDQKFPEELFFERTNKSTGDVDKIRYKYIDVAGEHDPVHKLDLPGNQQIAKYIGTWPKF